MTRTLLIAALLPLPLMAQDEGNESIDEGLGLLGMGLGLLMEGIIEEIEPALGEMERTLMLLEGIVGELDAYHAPEMLENGDIIIRRKVPLAPEGRPEVEL